MDSRRVGVIIFGIGMFLLWTPLYWNTLTNIGVTAALDPIHQLGPPIRGGYPVTVGATAMCVGGTGMVLSEIDEPPTNIFLASCLLGVGFGVLAVTIFTQISTVLAVQVGLAGAAPGFASVRGAATAGSRKRLGAALVCLSLAPLIGEPLVRGVTTSGWSMYINLVLVVTLITYTAVLSYPFYRLGRSSQ